ncbi:hypothetical protein [Streptomyces sp. XH2]|uniref:hypothetical protein n=1 Tax=Streptomyces sp. XH2 TaxID=3412483 RepID=UPI003C7B615B
MTRTRPRRLITISAALVGLLLVAGGAFYFSGSYENWRDERSLSAACKGLLSKEDTRSVLGGRQAYAQQDHQFDYLFSKDGNNGRIADCVLKGRKAHSVVAVDVRWSSKTRAPLKTLASELQQNPRTGTVPMGSGWPGSIASDDDQLFGIVELTCRNKPDESLLVSSRVLYLDADDESRAGLARFTTVAAKNAAERVGCDAAVGKDIGNVAPAPDRNPVQIGKATGTCAPVIALGAGAEQAGAVSAADAPSDPHAPAEDCSLTDAHGNQLYQLTASYGSLAENMRRGSREFEATDESGFNEEGHRGYGSAQCATSGKRSFYTLKAVSRGAGKGLTVKAPDPHFERAALKAFAEQSAKTHGCRDVKLP